MKTNLNKQKGNRSSNFLMSDYLTKVFLSKPRLIAKVDSIFKNGFNLVFQDQLIFVGKDKNQLSAFGLAIPANIFQEIKDVIDVGQQVRIQVSYSDAQEMNLSWTFYTTGKVVQIDMPGVTIVNTQLSSVAIDNFLDGNILNAFRRPSIWQGSGFSKTDYLSEKYQQLSAHWQNELAQSLMGAGIGLTPSGDDFLQGFMLMEMVTGEDKFKLTQYVKSVLDNGSTTKVSENYYKALLAGHVNITWTKLLEAVANHNLTSVDHYISEIQQYGATSGNDILLGVQMFLECYLHAQKQ